ncbi:MAG: hypothetical protein WCV71_04055 [Patescibacteria group bacterium]
MIVNRQIKALIVFTLLGLFLFVWLLKFGYFFSDDFTWLWHAQKMQSFRDIMTFKMSSYYSPVMNLFYYVSYKLFYYQAAYYFLFTILVHILSTFLVWLLLSKFVKNKLVVYLGAILFLVAGSAYESVIWISANIHSLTTLFILLAVYFYWLFLEDNKLKNAILVWLFFILALGTKEIAFISGPLIILTFIFFVISRKKLALTLYHKFLLFFIFIINAVYAFFEYRWQQGSVNISSGYWQLDFWQVLRWPVIIIDTIVPFGKLIDISNYRYFYVASFLLLILVIFILRKSLLFYYGLFWLLIASLPTIFAVDKWWMPLVSRYTYLPKVGAVLIFVLLLEKMYRAWPKKYFYALVSLIIIYNLAYWVIIAKNDYPYVYQSGRSLKQMVEEVGQKNPVRVFMVFPFPFENNNAHVVGAFSTLIDFSWERIIFVEENQLEAASPSPQDAVVYWDNKNRLYHIK